MIFSSSKNGLTVEGNPIESFRSDAKGSKYLYLIAGIHGDEVEGIFLLQKLFAWLSENHNMEDLPMIVVPILNIDGHYRLSKYNANGVDLNTNFPTNIHSSIPRKQTFLSELESSFIDQQFKKYPPGIVFNFMSQYPKITYSGNARDVVNYLSKLNSYPTKEEQVLDRGTICHYGDYHYKTPVINFYTSRINEDLKLNDIWEHNKYCFKRLFLSEILNRHLF